MMKDKSFETAMQRIAKQAEAEQENEIRTAARQRVIGRIKGIVVFLFIGAFVVTGLCYHRELQATIYAKIDSVKPSEVTDTNGTVVGTGLKGMTQAPNKVANSLATAQRNAAIRDSIIDQIAK